MFKFMFLFSPLPYCGILAILFMIACSPVSKSVKQRFFWPLPVSGVEPRIEYLGFWQSDKDLQPKGAGWVESAVLGEFHPVQLFESPFHIAALPGGRIAISDTVLRKVIILDPQKQEVRELMDDEGQPYRFSLPMGVAVSDEGDILVVDSMKGEVVRFGADEKLIGTFGGMSVLSHPAGIAVNNRAKLICVSDIGEHNIAVFDLWGNLLYKVGERGSQDGQFNFPTAVDFDENGNLFVLDTLNFRIQVFDSALRFNREFGELGTSSGSFRLPKGLAVSPYGHVYVSDGLSHKLVVFDLQGNYLLTLGDKAYALASGEVTPGGFFAPRGIEVDAAGQILVVDGMNKMIQRFQYLTDDYLKANPVSEEEIYLPPDLRLMPQTPFAPVSAP
jgi:DNA-binding beta-propeller fold protein YncE